MTKKLKILAIETSCDETAAAVIGSAGDFGDEKNPGPIILSNVVNSQIELHKKTLGVVPEVASRAHLEMMIPVIFESLERVNCITNPKSQTLNTKSPLSAGSRQQAGQSQITNYKLQKNNFNLLNMEANEASAKGRSTSGRSEARKALQEITHIAVTCGPGLIGSLLVGFNTAKALAYALDIPIIPINHIEGHIYSTFGGVNYNNQLPIISNQFLDKFKTQKFQTAGDRRSTTDKFPIIALTVSGGHTSIILMKDHGKYQTIGKTRDDAAGEAFDKVAKLLGLGYPGGPIVSKLAEQFRNNVKCQMSNVKDSIFEFPRPMLDSGDFDFSFSGLKTAVLQRVLDLTKSGRKLTNADKEEIAFAFEEAAVDVLVTKTLRAAERYKPKSIILAGGVAANARLRDEFTRRLSKVCGNIYFPEKEMCGDNAAMIGIAGYYHILRRETKNWDQIKIDSNLVL